MVIGGRPVMDPGDEDFPKIQRKPATGSKESGRGGSDRGSGDNRGRKDDR